jgi:tellurite resistance protein TerA
MINLTKSGESISLTKGIDVTKGTAPDVVINLNWNQQPQPKKGFLSSLLGGSGQIDLDVGLLYELQSGEKGVVQALGEVWGSLNAAPYMQLDGDDRSGSNAGGENIRINGQHWSRIRRAIVYAFIYEGAPNWDATDGVVTITTPSETVEVRMTGGQNNRSLCGIAMLENDGGAIKVTRLVDYYRDQKELDRAHGIGLNWSAGSK